MTKFKPANSYEPEAVELTPNRQALAELIAERDAARDAAKAETESSAKLGSVHDDVTPARAAVAALDAQNSIAWSNWSKGLVNGRPVADAARRAQLVAELADAELASAAAKAAQDVCQANVERLSRTLSQMNAKVLEAAQICAVEEAADLLPKIREAIANAEELHRQLEAARAEAAKGLGSFGVSSAVAPALERFDNARRAAEERPLPSVNPHGAQWAKFVAALTQDAEIDFDSAQAMQVSPVVVRAETIDPVSAAAAAIESFPTIGIHAMSRDIDDALEDALNAILACQTIRKAAVSRPLDSIRQSDVLRKVNSLAEPPRASDANERALEMLADAERRNRTRRGAEGHRVSIYATQDDPRGRVMALDKQTTYERDRQQREAQRLATDERQREAKQLARCRTLVMVAASKVAAVPDAQRPAMERKLRIVKDKLRTQERDHGASR